MKWECRKILKHGVEEGKMLDKNLKQNVSSHM